MKNFTTNAYATICTLYQTKMQNIKIRVNYILQFYY